MTAPSYGTGADGVPWLETVGDYDPRRGAPTWYADGRGTAKTLEERGEQSAVFRLWMRLAGLVDESGGNVHTYGPGVPLPEPRLVDIRFVGEEDEVEGLTWEDVLTAQDAGLLDLAAKISALMLHGVGGVMMLHPTGGDE